MRIACLLILCLQINAAIAQPQAVSDFTLGKVFAIESTVLNEQREYMVSLPASYQGDDFYIEKSYPVLVVLDGERLFELAAGMVHAMSSGGTEQIPEMIVVGVPNTDRSRDMLPNYDIEAGQEANASGAVSFRRFLEEELVPAVQENYRTTNCRILVGHSYSGLFAADSFLESTEFNGYVAIDPSLWWDDRVLVKRANQLLAAKEKFTSSIYFGQANNPFNEGMEAGRLGRALQAFTRTLDTLKVDGLRYQTRFYPDEDHYSIPLITLYHGFQFVFEGYKYPLNQVKGTSGELIRQHYLSLSERMGGQLLPPGKLLNQVGLYLLEEEGYGSDAIKILEFNKESYPGSHIPWFSLAEAYRLSGNYELAIGHYSECIRLDPSNDEARARIAELKK